MNQIIKCRGKFQKLWKVNKAALLAALSMAFLLTACSRSMSYTYTIDTGDQITVKLDISDGYTMRQEDGGFAVYNEEDTLISQGFFIDREMYEAYLSSIEEAGATIIAEGEEDGCIYTQYQLALDTHTEDNYICWIEGSSTGAVVASMEGQTEAEQVFALLSFEVAG